MRKQGPGGASNEFGILLLTPLEGGSIIPGINAEVIAIPFLHRFRIVHFKENASDACDFLHLDSPAVFLVYLTPLSKRASACVILPLRTSTGAPYLESIDSLTLRKYFPGGSGIVNRPFASVLTSRTACSILSVIMIVQTCSNGGGVQPMRTAGAPTATTLPSIPVPPGRPDFAPIFIRNFTGPCR